MSTKKTAVKTESVGKKLSKTSREAGNGGKKATVAKPTVPRAAKAQQTKAKGKPAGKIQDAGISRAKQSPKQAAKQPSGAVKPTAKKSSTAKKAVVKPKASGASQKQSTGQPPLQLELLGAPLERGPEERFDPVEFELENGFPYLDPRDESRNPFLLITDPASYFERMANSCQWGSADGLIYSPVESTPLHRPKNLFVIRKRDPGSDELIVVQDVEFAEWKTEEESA